MARVRVVVSGRGMAELRSATDRQAIHPITDAVAADARRYVPVLSGALRGTIRAEHNVGNGRVWCGDVPRVDYHLYQEYGTSRMGAQPYMRVSLFQKRGV
jgi:hypothetical protein